MSDRRTALTDTEFAAIQQRIERLALDEDMPNAEWEALRIQVHKDAITLMWETERLSFQLAVYRSAVIIDGSHYQACKLCGSSWGHKEREFPEYPEWHYRTCRLARFALVGDGRRDQVLRPWTTADAHVVNAEPTDSGWRARCNCGWRAHEIGPAMLGQVANAHLAEHGLEPGEL